MCLKFAIHRHASSFYQQCIALASLSRLPDYSSLPPLFSTPRPETRPFCSAAEIKPSVPPSALVALLSVGLRRRGRRAAAGYAGERAHTLLLLPPAARNVMAKDFLPLPTPSSRIKSRPDMLKHFRQREWERQGVSDCCADTLMLMRQS